ncbi:MAG: shikimate dehydrogenase [Deltaproteobacteria bacterium RIFCSPLOWO2_01_FULL_42_9]|nr:MAG: shikimate dehydrogenase [Deltaproteobacteria bacterium RIFCSPLOWO2_01_FULL_42_9]
MNITSKTKTLGIFGHPISHTLSPVMHNAVIKALGLDMAYLPFEVKPPNLKEAINGIKSLGIIGVSITIPHKESVIRFLDDISEEARLVGAVNTIVNKDRKLVGYNTDGSGYMASLKEELGFNPKSKRIIIIGAGGAARGILAALATQKPKSITVANRTLSRAVSLIKAFKGKFRDTRFEAINLDDNMLKMSFNSVDLLINTTSVGMKQGKTLKIPLETLPKIAIVSDIIYNPLETLLLKKAKKIGLTTHGGLGMLVHQGARSFKLWTGMDAPMNVMRKAALKALKMEVGSRK